MCYHDVDVQQRVPTVSRKSERLVNLTIALLATKRWLTKSQIFNTVDGYEGEPDAMERMFERDKDDLRNLGITIEVGTFDPLFEDEVGYRIRPENYRTDISSITPRELSLISVATQAWQGAVLDSTALSALVKLKSLGIDSDFDSIPAITPTLHNSDSNFLAVINAIAQRQVISFSYLGPELDSDNRALEPYGVGTKSGHWYVAGRDLDRKEQRLFRLDRFHSEVKAQGKAGSYEIPQDFLMKEVLAAPETSQIATLKVRRGKAHSLRLKATSVEDGDDWSEITVPFIDEAELINEVLWHGTDVVVISPRSARESTISALEEIVRIHG
ncbi:proteasome accessory factor B [Candidatus Planktophila sulfonica]|uniref:Proteasome accessory factor B n=1 Tax=Candidatus Planktophila sulfonica TaxID=1884904 RepID=A0A249KGK6_9ACTN|nr:proteasome accessory factor B [Candidatus Planktophila sulfonica]